MSTDDLCNHRSEVMDTSEVNEESAPVPTTNDFGLILLVVHYDMHFMHFSLAMK
jgi:hypothetical protein